MKLLCSFTSSEYVFIGPGLSDREEGIPFNTDAGKLLKLVFSTLSIEPNLVELNKDDFNDDEWTDEAISQFKQILDEHKNIKYVVYLGRPIATAISPSICAGVKSNVLQNMGFLPSRELGGIKVAVVYHPRYIYKSMKEDKESSDPLDSYRARIESLIFGDKNKSSYHVNVNKVTMSEFIDIMPMIEQEDVIAFDYETNGAEIFNEDFKVTIVSFAVNPKGGNEIYSWWIHFDDKENPITQDQMDRYHKFIKDISHKLWAYNCTFEGRVNWRLFGEFIKIQDAMVLMIMNSTRDTLKNSVRRFLNADFWESDVTYYRKQFESIFKTLGSDKKSGCKYSDVKDLSTLSEAESVMIEKGFPESYLSFFSEMKYDLSEDEILGYIKEYPYAWGSVPREILGPYCAYDSAYTIPLVRMFYNQYEDGYPVYIRHMWLSTLFMSNGIRWDDNEAENLAQFCLKTMQDSLHYLCQNLSTISQEDKLKELEYYSTELPFNITTYTCKTHKEKIYTVATEYDRLGWMKTILNLNSNIESSRRLFWDDYYTADVEAASFAYCLIDSLRLKGIWEPYILDRLSKIEVPENVNAEDYLLSTFGTSSERAVKLMEDVVQYGEEQSSEVLSTINSAINEIDKTYKELTYGKYAMNIVNTQFQIQRKFFDLNIDDESTWTREFRLLFNMQLYKKLAKTLTTSIDGANGRANVFEVRDFNQNPPVRLKHFENHDDEKYYLIEYDFNALAVATHRWSSAFHTVVSGSPVRKCLLPRNDSGVWYHIDFSQAELVVLAFFSKDPKMMQVYLDRGDMHRYIASKIFNKDPDDITSDERRASKSVEFGIIYGKSVENTAVDVTGGDVAKAQALFDAFYGAFPGISVWMDSKRREVDQRGKVSNLFGGNIEIDVTQPGNGRYRQAVNYPIQSTSSMIAGCAMWELQQYCHDHKLKQLSYGFTHDSLDSSTHIDDIFDFMDAAYLTMEKNIYRDLGAPMHIDIEVGINGYQLTEISDVTRIDNRITFELSGLREDVNDLLTRFQDKSKWNITKKELVKSKEIYTSWADMFAPKGAYKSTYGNKQIKETYNIELTEK